MSYQGIRKAAAVFRLMQETRIELIGMGAKDCKTMSGHQDILLGQMLNTGHEAMKRRFTQLTSDPKLDPGAAADEKRRAAWPPFGGKS